MEHLSLISLAIAFVCALIIIADLLRGHKQRMTIMNFVYPITALYAGPLALVFYFTIGRKAGAPADMRQPPQSRPFWQSVAIGALHCGSGCTLGDIAAQLFLVQVPVVILSSQLAGDWTIEYIFAFIIGIVFQYYALKPMKHISPLNALYAALKADSLSLTSWQLGMYGWMAISLFYIPGYKNDPHDPMFWLMMQVSMVVGFITAYPVNWWLLKKGIKEIM